MTLRARLVAAMLAVAMAVVVTGVVVVSTQRQYLLDQLDQRLDRSSLPTARLSEIPLPPGSSPFFSFDNLPSGLVDLYLAQLDAAGQEQQVLLPGRSGKGPPSLAGLNLPRLAQEQTAVSVDAGDGGSYRVRVLAAGSSFVAVGLPQDSLDASIRRLTIVTSAAAVVVLVLLGLVGWWVVRLGLRPIRGMTSAADAIAAGDLDRRVERLPLTTEAGRLARAFNVMLDERQGSEERLRQFVANASHELRTPLTSIRGYVALYRGGGLEDRERLDDAMRRVSQEAGRMGELVEDMLLLARLDAGRPLADEPVDLTTVLVDSASDATAVHHDRPLRVDVDEGLQLRGDEARLRQVFGALLTNAFVHNGDVVRVTVRAHRDGDVCVVEVVDDGAGMSPELEARVFERFVRGDAGRSRHKGGSGLGLAIVRSVIESHGGAVALTTAQGKGTTVRVTLPVDGPGSGAVRGRAPPSEEIPSRPRANS